MNDKVHKAEKAFRVTTENLRSIMMEDTLTWLESKISTISKAFTNELHYVLREFLDFKFKTFSRIAECAWYQENVKVLELTLARKMPVYEAEYGMSETTPIRLYDCLVPRIKEHKKKHIDIRGNLKMDDFKA